MFILKTSPQQSYAFKEGISFSHSWICLLLFSIKTYIGLAITFAAIQVELTSFCVCYFNYVQKNKVASPHLDYLT